MGDKQIISVAISCPDATQAEELGTALVEAHLAACAQVTPIRSVYHWEGEIARDDEVLLTLKTTAACFEPLRAMIRKTHPDDVPQITATPVSHIDKDYADWIVANTDT